LKAPVRRLGAPRIPVGYAPSLENEVKIKAERDILPAIRGLMES
jgi:pyruvate dehydrogenase E1 component beta subunit